MTFVVAKCCHLPLGTTSIGRSRIAFAVKPRKDGASFKQHPKQNNGAEKLLPLKHDGMQKLKQNRLGFDTLNTPVKG